ncbi:MAG: hypothetical protein MEP44_05020 [Blastomonas sp.]|nr:hypothetical protein [Blastomonas sp.]
MDKVLGFLMVVLTIACLAFFFVGEAYFDTSGELGLRENFWFISAQWVALILPGLVAILAMKSTNRINRTINAQD